MNLRHLPAIAGLAAAAALVPSLAIAQSEDAADFAPSGSQWEVYDTAVTFDDMPTDGGVVIDAFFFTTEGLSIDEGLQRVSAQITDPTGAEVAGTLTYVETESIVLWIPDATLEPDTSYGGAVTFANSGFEPQLGVDRVVQVVIQTGTSASPAIEDVALRLDAASDDPLACCPEGDSCERPAPALTVGYTLQGGPSERLTVVDGTAVGDASGACSTQRTDQVVCTFSELADEYCVELTATSRVNGSSASERLCVDESEIARGEVLVCPAPAVKEGGCSMRVSSSGDDRRVPVVVGVLLAALGIVRRRSRHRADHRSGPRPNDA